MDVVAVTRTRQSERMPRTYDVVVVGAGPYGLSAAAHLRGKGLQVAIFGKPLESWREMMPRGMFLRSHWWATNFSDPQKKYSMKQFFQVSDYDVCYPMPVQLFIDYGMWFQKHVVPDVDPTYVSSVERKGESYEVFLEDGRVVVALAIVMAIGPGYYARIPAEYSAIPAGLLTHSYNCGDFSHLAGKRVAVIGGGQSAVECAALLNEAGVTVHLVARRPINWVEPHGGAARSFLEQLRAPNSGIAPGWRYRALEIFPYFFQRFPPEKRARMVNSTHWPGASEWLRERIIGKVILHESCAVVQVIANKDKVNLAFSDATGLEVDHIILATGYQADVERLTMLDVSIRECIKTYAGSPLLNSRFESSVPGLYFPGFSSLLSFGPLYRFIAGVPATSARVAGAVAQHIAYVR